MGTAQLKDCPACGTRISTNADVCPSCGHRQGTSVVAYLLSIPVFILFVTCCVNRWDWGIGGSLILFGIVMFGGHFIEKKME